MYFTQEDYRKIEKWLLANSIKDTEFVGATTPLQGNETIAFVQNGQNVKVLLKDLIDQIFLLGVSDFLNITEKYNETNISLTQAIQLVPFKSRKVGQVITFLNEDNKWVLYQFTGVLNQWNNNELWVDLIKSIQGLSIIDSEDIVAEVNTQEQTSLLLANKNYNEADYSGLGRIYLRKNITKVTNPTTGALVTVNLLTQDMISKENTIYIIQYDYDLNEQTITIPDNSILLFEGGHISSGTINLINTLIQPQGEDITKFITSNITGTYLVGQALYDTINSQNKYYDGSVWVLADGYNSIYKRNGDTNNRPNLSENEKYFRYFDTDLNYWITWTGLDWIEDDGYIAGERNSDGTLISKVIII